MAGLVESRLNVKIESPALVGRALRRLGSTEVETLTDAEGKRMENLDVGLRRPRERSTRVTLLLQMAFCLAELHLWSTKSSLQRETSAHWSGSGGTPAANPIPPPPQPSPIHPPTLPAFPTPSPRAAVSSEHHYYNDKLQFSEVVEDKHPYQETNTHPPALPSLPSPLTPTTTNPPSPPSFAFIYLPPLPTHP
ncbi:hypothetical protein INR49_007620 [Caranx melampygus]|nr:hypothetical protein INR49_007620 [Caranx melampygus]